MTGMAETATAEASLPRGRAYWAVAMLMLAAFFSFLDRQILGLLMPAIKADLHVTDVQLGLLAGPAFAFLFAFLAVPFGWAADRWRRTGVIATGVAIWSLATVWSGFSHSFTQLLLARVLIGVGEASLMPSAYSLLADYFPPGQRGRAFGVFMMAVFLGSGAALIVGGVVLHALGAMARVSLPLLGVLPIWKAGFIVVGLPGLLVSGLMLTVHEPARRGHAGEARGEGGGGLLAYVKRHPAAFAVVMIAYSLLGMVSFQVSPWAPTLLVRHFGMSLPAAGIRIGLISLTTGLVGAWVGGALADRWTQRNVTGTKLRTALVFFIGCFPGLALFVLGPSVGVALAGLLLMNFVNFVSYVAASAVTQDMVPGRLRGRMTAFWYLVTGIIGNGMGPFLAPLVAARVFHSEAALPWAMLAVAFPSVIVGGLTVAWGLKAYDRARADAMT